MRRSALTPDLPGRVEPEIWVIGGGKGGTGKTLLCANLAIDLAQNGERVIAVDADFGGPNLHTALGVPPPERSLTDFLHRFVPIILIASKDAR